MTVPITAASTRRLALIFAGINLAVMLVNISLRLWLSTSQGWDWLWSTFWFLVAIIVYSAVGVMILARYPRHAIGWLCLTIGLLLGLVILLSVLQTLEPTTRFGPVASLFWWICHIAFVPAFILPLSLMLVFFPDGQLPSPRWRPVVAAALLGIVGASLSIAFYPWPWEQVGIEDAHNPLAIPGSEEILWLLVRVSAILIAIGVFGSLSAVVVRFRRSQGVERVQMKWLVYTAAGGMSVAFLLSLILGPYISYSVLLSLPTLLAIAIGIAILRYRLWDIDVIIRKTLVYGALTGLLALIYFTSILLLTNLMSAVSGQQSTAVYVVSTLAVAALFNPLRRRIQDLIDRRFYRRRYDAEEILASFSLTAREEVDLESLSVALLNVVADTMQPESTSVWLREAPHPQPLDREPGGFAAQGRPRPHDHSPHF